MACGGCRKNNNNNQSSDSNLKKFAYLTPRQLRLLKELEEQENQNKVEE